MTSRAHTSAPGRQGVSGADEESATTRQESHETTLRQPDRQRWSVLRRTVVDIAANVERVLVGKPEVVRIALVTLLAEGHLLVEDVPGVGKTSLAKALARSIDCTINRIQFTPDL